MREGYLERLERLRPIDDDFARCVFKGQPRLAGAVLSAVLGAEVEVAEVRTQYDVDAIAGGRSVTLDVLCVGPDGALYDVEAQRDLRGAAARRARYHGSAMDVDALTAGDAFGSLPDRCVVFLCEHDPFGEGMGTYSFDTREAGTGRLLGDGTRTVYANAGYEGVGPLGDLMHDLLEADPGRMRFPEMAERVRYLKRTEEGVSEMCEIFDEIRREGVQEGLKEGIDIGRSEGIDIGRSEGIDIGRSEGRSEQVLASARSLMEGLSVGVNRALELLGVSEQERPHYQELLEAGVAE